MLSRTTYLASSKDKSDDRQTYRQRVAAIQMSSSSAALELDSPVAPSEPDSPPKRNRGRKVKSAARAFYKWFVRLALIAMIVFLVSLIIFVWGPSTHPGNAEVKIEIDSRMTAQNAQEFTKPVILDWADDARLVRMSATWDGGQKFQNGEGDWTMLYYSPSKASSASMTIHEGQARVIAVHGVPDPIEFQNDKSWLIDSETAVDFVKAVGGDEFLRAQPDATVSMSLDFAQDAVWRVRLIDQMSRRVFSAKVDMEGGEITEILQSG